MDQYEWAGFRRPRSIGMLAPYRPLVLPSICTRHRFELTTSLLAILTMTLCCAPASASQFLVYQCDVGGKSVTLHTNLSAWLPSAVPNCVEIERDRRLQLPHHPPDPQPLNLLFFLNATMSLQTTESHEAIPELTLDAIGSRAKHHAAIYGLSHRVVLAVIKAESAFNQRARSSKGALGLMQVMPSTARDYGVHDARDLLQIDENIRVGTSHLARLMQRFGGDLPLALAAYNAGEGAVIRSGWRVPPYLETERYVEKIMRSLNEQIE